MKKSLLIDNKGNVLEQSGDLDIVFDFSDLPRTEGGFRMPVKRVVLSALLVAVVWGSVFIGASLGMSSNEPEAVPVVEYIVRPGETLWDIARQYPGDPRKTVYEIREMNDLESAIIYPGQKLIVRRCEK